MPGDDDRPNEVRVVTATFPDRSAALGLADRLVGDGVAACAQVGGPVTSVYRWQGRVERDEEWTLTVKTVVATADRVVEMIVGEHPYDTPEVLVGAVDGGHGPYLDWVLEHSGPDRPGVA